MPLPLETGGRICSFQRLGREGPAWCQELQIPSLRTPPSPRGPEGPRGTQARGGKAAAGNWLSSGSLLSPPTLGLLPL